MVMSRKKHKKKLKKVHVYFILSILMIFLGILSNLLRNLILAIIFHASAVIFLSNVMEFYNEQAKDKLTDIELYLMVLYLLLLNVTFLMIFIDI